MARYVDIDALSRIIKLAWDTSDSEDFEKSVFIALETAPTADVVEVVRCKDCKHSVKHQLGYGCGMNYHLATNGNWFCADGERR